MPCLWGEGPWKKPDLIEKSSSKKWSQDRWLFPKRPPGQVASYPLSKQTLVEGSGRNSFLWTQIAWVSKFLNVISISELRHDIYLSPLAGFLRVENSPRIDQSYSREPAALRGKPLFQKNHPWTKDSLSDPTIYKDWVTYIPKVVTQGVWTNSKTDKNTLKSHPFWRHFLNDVRFLQFV